MRENALRFFDFPKRNQAVSCLENPRVAGSIPSLATISNSMIRNGFRVSPADRPASSMADPRTIGKWVGGSTPCGVRPGELAIGEPWKLAA